MVISDLSVISLVDPLDNCLQIFQNPSNKFCPFFQVLKSASFDEILAGKYVGSAILLSF